MRYSATETKAAMAFLDELGSLAAENVKRRLEPIISEPSRLAHLISFIVWADVSGKFDEKRAAIAHHLLTVHFKETLSRTIAFDASLNVCRDNLYSGLAEGQTCGVCGQHAKEYRRKLNVNMANFMKSLVRLHYLSVAGGEDGWVHHSELQYTGRDYTMCAHWGLAKTKRADAEEDGTRQKKTTGYWYPTPEGIAFVRGELAVKKYIYMYNGSCREDDSSPYIRIQDALGERFQFSDLFTKKEDK